MKNYKLILLILLIINNISAKEVFVDDEIIDGVGDYNLYVLDETIKKTNNKGEKEFWVKARAKNNKNPIAHMDVLANIDCNQKKTKIVYITAYDKSNDIIESGHTYDGYEPLTPTDMEEDINGFNMICKSR